YKVASRIALEARARQGERAACQQPLPDLPAAEAPSDLIWRDLRPVLDEEINRLPAKYRVPFVLCYLEGKTNEEAAQQLGCPKGTVLSRLSRARQRLRDRLTRRGLTLSVGLLTTTATAEAWSATVPVLLIQSTLKAALASAADKSLAGMVSAPVALLTQG